MEKTQEEQLNLLSKKNVHILMKSTRKKNGIDTGQECYTAGVEKKVPKEQLNERDIIPDDIDVVEFPKIQLAHTNKHRPVYGGISAHKNANIEYVGTLGLVVIDNTTNKLVGLTNNHCVGHMYDDTCSECTTPSVGSSNTVGIQVTQPGPGDDFANRNSNIIGSVVRAVPYKCGSNTTMGPINTVDCAIFSIDLIDNAWFTIHNLAENPLPFAASKNEYSIDESVKKSGRTSFVTTNGTIEDKNGAFSIPVGDNTETDMCDYVGPIIIKSSTPFIQGGDSGSVLISQESGKVIGLLFASTIEADQDGKWWSMACHIVDVVNELNISAWEGHVVVEHNTNNQITINGRQFQRIGDTSLPITHTVD